MYVYVGGWSTVRVSRGSGGLMDGMHLVSFRNHVLTLIH